MYISSPWTTYAAVLSPLTLGYYVFIAYKFYRQDLRSAFSGKQNRPAKKPARAVPTMSVIQPKQPQPVDTETTEPVLPSEETFQKVLALSAHLRDAIEEAHSKQYTKNELILLIQLHLKEYAYFKNTPFRISINNQIEAECAKYGSMLLSEDDTAELWI